MAPEDHTDASNQGSDNPRPGRGLRWWIGVICITLACLGFVSKFLGQKKSATESQAESRPINVLLITADTTRADALACYGSKEANTPNIDRLASQGVMFTNCASCAAVTLPSHASIMTGMYPFLHGTRANVNYRMSDANTTLAEVFEASKYKTKAVVASYVLNHSFGIAQGFEEYLDVPLPPPDQAAHAERKGDLICEDAITQLRSVADSPFFLWTHFYDPHHPYVSDLHGPNSREAYNDEVTFMDTQIGRLLDELRTLGLEENTLVVLVGDHGEGLGDHGEPTHGTFLYNTTTRVPLIMRYTGKMLSGVSVDSLVRTVDIAPTILEIVGGKPLPGMTGTSLVPLLKQETDDLELAAYAEALDMLTSRGLAPLRSLTFNNMVYIRAPKPELYDLSTDPGQTKNVYEQFPDVAESMNEEMRDLVSQVEIPDFDSSQEGMSEQQLRILQSLGYMQGEINNPEFSGLPELAKLEGELDRPNPKDYVKELALYEEALQLMETGNKEGAEEALRQVHEALPNGFATTVLLTKTLRSTGKAEEALEILLKADNDTMSYKPELGETYVALERWEDAISVYQKILAPRNESSVVQLGQDRLYNQLGIALTNLGRMEEALDAFKKAVEHRPDEPKYVREYANTLEKMGRIDEAAVQYRQCLVLDPSDAATVNNLTWILATTTNDDVRDCEQAVIGAEKLVAILKHPSPAVLDTLAAAYACGGQFDKAVETAETAIKLTESPESEALKALGEQIKKRLTLYRQQKPYRE